VEIANLETKIKQYQAELSSLGDEDFMIRTKEDQKRADRQWELRLLLQSSHIRVQLMSEALVKVQAHVDRLGEIEEKPDEPIDQSQRNDIGQQVWS
jgi:hypothetical protein